VQGVLPSLPRFVMGPCGAGLGIAVMTHGRSSMAPTRWIGHRFHTRMQRSFTVFSLQHAVPARMPSARLLDARHVARRLTLTAATLSATTTASATIHCCYSSLSGIHLLLLPGQLVIRVVHPDGRGLTEGP
jgi:hypothetical protein